MKYIKIIKLAKNLKEGQTIEWDFKKRGSAGTKGDRSRGDFYFYATSEYVGWSKQLSKVYEDYFQIEKDIEDMKESDWKYLTNTLRRKSKSSQFYGGFLFAYDEKKSKCLL